MLQHCLHTLVVDCEVTHGACHRSNMPSHPLAERCELALQPSGRCMQHAAALAWGARSSLPAQHVTDAVRAHNSCDAQAAGLQQATRQHMAACLRGQVAPYKGCLNASVYTLRAHASCLGLKRRRLPPHKHSACVNALSALAPSGQTPCQCAAAAVPPTLSTGQLAASILPLRPDLPQAPTRMDASVDLPLPLVPHNRTTTQRRRSLKLHEDASAGQA